MKKVLALLLSLIMSLSTLPTFADEATEVIVFAAASLTETLTALGEIYHEAHPEVTILFNFDSSGTLKTQIQEGADCDLFLSAGQKQMNQLDQSASAQLNPEGLDFVLQGTRRDILEKKVAFVVPDGNPKALTGYEALVQGLQDGSLLLAMGNADVPVGQYTQKIFTFFGLDEAALAQTGVLTYATNVKEITTQVAEAAVDCGIVYQTDAFSAGLTVVDTATPDMCGQVIYPAAVMKATRQPEAAKAFLDFLFSDTAKDVFAAAGFTPLGE